jgi:hypothetical protein
MSIHTDHGRLVFVADRIAAHEKAQTVACLPMHYYFLVVIACLSLLRSSSLHLLLTPFLSSEC